MTEADQCQATELFATEQQPIGSLVTDTEHTGVDNTATVV